MLYDYTLLRSFDLDLAANGEALCNTHGEPIHSLITEIPDCYGQWPVWIDEVGGRIDIICAAAMRMAPLFLVEGKPVYKGDVLYSLIRSLHGETRTVVGVDTENGVDTKEKGTRTCFVTDLTWEPAKKKYKAYVYMMNDGTLYVERNELQPYQLEGIARVEALEWEGLS
ncbi:MAG: hypothetical protein WC322_07045 [Candidatus Paceibacterota bacterium]|jgi:hypothetical protein